MKSHQQYTELYRQHGDTIRRFSCEAMNAAREAALEALERQGLPSTREERYKYTDTEAAFAPDYGLNVRRIAPEGDPYTTFKCRVPNLSTSIFFVMNDVPCPAPAGSRALLPEGAVVSSICRLAAERPELIRRHYNRAAGEERGFRSGADGVTLLNTLLAQDGIVIYLPEGTCLKAPVQIVNVAAARTDSMSVRRVLVIAEKGAKGAVLFCDHAEGGARYLSTQVTEVFAAERAEIDLYGIEETTPGNTRFSTLFVEQAEGSRVTCNDVTLTGGLTRNRIDVRLRGEKAETELCGAAIAGGGQRVDYNVIVEHLAPKCVSNMLYKNVLDGQSRGAFAGKVYVAPGAQQTSSLQTNANLCTAEGARAFSQPMLEIYADDVKCNHGSTIGKLDETALFYMRQRGIPEAEARLLLQHAFVNEVLRHVRIEHLYDRLAKLVDQRFRGELGKCRTCKGCAR